MPEAHEFREPEELIVRVWGMANGHAFFQNAHARDLTSAGAMLYGIEHALQPEDIIGVQYGEKKARFRVVGVRDVGLPQHIQADVELLSGQECPWKDLAIDRAARAEPSLHLSQATIKDGFPAQGRASAGSARRPWRARAHENCHCRCQRPRTLRGIAYPLPLANPSAPCLFGSRPIGSPPPGWSAPANPGVGMGIEFVDLDDAAQKRLQKFLEKLAAESGNSMATS